MATIIADTRENNGAIPYFPALIEKNNAKNCKLPEKIGGGEITLQIAQVTTGDYHIVFDGKIVLSIERKTWADLSSSIKDRRLKSQHKKLLELQKRTGCRLLYIIEGPLKSSGKRGKHVLPFTTLHTNIRHMYLRGVPYFHAADGKQVAEIIVNFARDFMKMHRRGEIELFVGSDGSCGRPESMETESSKDRIIPTDPVSLVSAYKSAIDEVNEKFADLFSRSEADFSEYRVEAKELDLDDMSFDDDLDESYNDDNIEGGDEPDDPPLDEIIDHAQELLGDGTTLDIETVVKLGILHQEDPENVPKILLERKTKQQIDVLEEMWCAIKNVSSKSVSVLVEKYKLRDLLCADTAMAKQMKAEISDMQYPGSGRRFGPKMANSIVSIAYTGGDAAKTERVRAMSTAMLTKIPGVSADTAKLILRHYSLRQICMGEVTANQIADIRRANSRRIGPALAKKIIKLLGR